MKTLLLQLVLVLPAFGASVNGAYVEAGIEQVPNSPNFIVYTYKIVNGGGSKDFVKTFTIDVKGRSMGVASTSVPGAANWTFMGIRNDELAWAANDNGVGIGRSSGIIKLKSDGLPAIRMYRLAPSMENSKIPFTPPQDASELKTYLKKVEDFKRSSEAQGLTLAPVAPPNPFIPLAFMDIVIQNFKETASNGIVKNRTGMGELTQKLKIIRTALENNNPNSAKSLSENLINQLAIQKNSYQPEVIALVKYNLQFMISQLAKQN